MFNDLNVTFSMEIYLKVLKEESVTKLTCTT